MFIQFLSEYFYRILIAEKRPQGCIDEGAFGTLSASALIGGLVVFDDLEIIIAAAEDIEILMILSEDLGDLDLIHASQEAEIFYLRREVTLDVLIEVSLELIALASLVIDDDAVQDGISFICALFIGHHDITVVIEIGSSHEDESYDSADRNMTVVISLSVHFKEQGINSSEHDQSRGSDAVADHFMEIVIFAECRRIERDIEFFDRFYADQRIFPSSQGDHRNGGGRMKERSRSLFVSIDEIAVGTGRKLVSIEEFTESLGIEILPEEMLILSELSGLDHKFLSRTKLIIADSDSEGEVEEKRIHDGRIDRGERCESRTAEIYGFREIDLMIEGIRKRCDKSRSIE